MRRLLFVTVLALAAGAISHAQAQPAAPGRPAPTATTASAPRGNYECWSSGEANMTLNFTITSPGQYTAADGSAGTFTIAANGTTTFTGYEGEALPENFTINYHVAQGRPTFSFMGPSGSEAAFCEKAD